MSRTQINFQMPSATPATAVQVVVNNQAVSGTRALRASQQHTSTLTVADPQLFVTSGGAERRPGRTHGGNADSGATSEGSKWRR